MKQKRLHFCDFFFFLLLLLVLSFSRCNTIFHNAMGNQRYGIALQFIASLQKRIVRVECQKIAGGKLEGAR